MFQDTLKPIIEPSQLWEWWSIKVYRPIFTLWSFCEKNWLY